VIVVGLGSWRFGTWVQTRFVAQPQYDVAASGTSAPKPTLAV
jgi:hypothetical protein